jgi:hypothetical protein
VVWVVVVAAVAVWFTVIALAWMLCVAVARGERRYRAELGRELPGPPVRRRFRRPAA